MGTEKEKDTRESWILENGREWRQGGIGKLIWSEAAQQAVRSFLTDIRQP